MVRTRREAVSSSATEPEITTLAELPLEPLGLIFGAVLTYAELRAACAACTFFGRVAAHVRSLTVRTQAELHTAPLHRFGAVELVVVQCFTVPARHSPTGLEQELCAAPGMVLMFASRLPRLRKIHLGGCFNDAVCEPEGDEWAQQQWVAVDGDLALLDDIFMESDNLRLDHSYVSYDDLGVAGGGECTATQLIRALVHGVCDAYRGGALHPRVRWAGLFGGTHDHRLEFEQCSRDMPCGLCEKVLHSVPPEYLLEFSPSREVIYGEAAILREAVRRGADLDGPQALERVLDACRGLPIESHGEMIFVAQWSSRSYQRMRNLVLAGADPTRQRVADKIRLRQRCSMCASSQGWCRGCERMTNSGALHNFGFPDEPPSSKRLLLKEQFDALRALGIPLRSTDVTVVSITHPKMVPPCNRGLGDWRRYGEITPFGSEDEEDEDEDLDEDEDEFNYNLMV